MTYDDEADELALMINNDADIYRSMIVPTQINMARKMVNGTYSAVLAKKAWLNVVEKACGDKKFSRRTLHDWKPQPQVKKLAREYVMAHQSAEVVDRYKKMLRLKEAGKPWSMRG
jgi:hypothetical protein